VHRLQTLEQIKAATEKLWESNENPDFDKFNREELIKELVKLFAYRRHHEFVIQQTAEAVGKPLKTVGDYLEIVTHLTTREAEARKLLIPIEWTEGDSHTGEYELQCPICGGRYNINTEIGVHEPDCKLKKWLEE